MSRRKQGTFVDMIRYTLAQDGRRTYIILGEWRLMKPPAFVWAHGQISGADSAIVIMQGGVPIYWNESNNLLTINHTSGSTRAGWAKWRK